MVSNDKPNTCLKAWENFLILSTIRTFKYSRLLKTMPSFSCEQVILHEFKYPIILILLYSIVGILNILENALVIITILLTPSLRKKSNILLVNVAFIDLLVGMIAVPLTVINIHLMTDTPCSIVIVSNFFSPTLCAASVYSLCTLNLDRYFRCSKLNLYALFMSKKKYLA